MKYRKLSYEEHKQLLAEFAAGEPRKQLCEKYEIAWQSLYNYIKKRPTMYNTRSDFKLNHHYFDNIDNEAKAYWLGFIYADGNVSSTQNQLRIGVATKDSEHIEKFYRLELQSNSKKYVYEDTVHFHADSEQLVKSLKVNGVFPAKTFKLKPPTIQKQFISHFIRGYFDGDGCITKGPAIEFIGTKALLRWIQVQLKVEQKYHAVSINKKVQCFWIGGRHKTTAVYKYLYENATIYLVRKKEKFEKLLGLSKTHKA